MKSKPHLIELNRAVNRAARVVAAEIVHALKHRAIVVTAQVEEPRRLWLAVHHCARRHTSKRDAVYQSQQTQRKWNVDDVYLCVLPFEKLHIVLRVKLEKVGVGRLPRLVHRHPFVLGGLLGCVCVCCFVCVCIVCIVR